jgi:glutamyl-Q tRNA(Asp) synthetase
MTQRSRPTFRFAPSPNGRLHLGHALSALTGWEMARRLGGRFLVRIEDIDTVRCPRHLARAALDDLAWLGLAWEEPVLHQSEHFADYAAAADRLANMGLLYPCFASRTEIAAAAAPDARDPDGAPLYPGLWRGAPPAEVARRRARGEPFALRLDMVRALKVATAITSSPLTYTALDEDGDVAEVEVHPERWGDAVIVRKDTPTSYNLAVVIDDARQGITHVTRGMDLLAATDLHRLLQVLLRLPAPLYHHHRLLTDDAGRKLAKSARDTSLADLRAAGWTPAEVRRAVGL